VPDRNTILRWVSNFRESGAAIKRKPPGRPKSVRIANNVERVKQAIQQSPTRSAHKQSLALQIPRTTLRRIVSNDLNMHPYKLQVVQKLEPGDPEQRMIFCETMLVMIVDEDFPVSDVFFSDEAHFDLHGNVNRQNMRYYAETNPKVTREKPLHSPRVTVWCALNATTIIGPYFFEDETGANVTVNSERYLHMLKAFFLPELKRKRIPLRKVWFQQDGATSHTTNEVLAFLKSKFGNRLISRRTSLPWPPRSPDLNSPDFYLWGHLKAEVYATRPASIVELKMKIREAIARIPVAVLNRVSENFVKKIRECLNRGGKHLDDVIFKTI
jgi:hypothetical protein